WRRRSGMAGSCWKRRSGKGIGDASRRLNNESTASAVRRPKQPGRCIRRRSRRFEEERVATTTKSVTTTKTEKNGKSGATATKAPQQAAAPSKAAAPTKAPGKASVPSKAASSAPVAPTDEDEAGPPVELATRLDDGEPSSAVVEDLLNKGRAEGFITHDQILE